MIEDFIDLGSDRAELLRMLQELHLARADETPQVTLLTGGVSSNIFRVDLSCGPVCVKQALPKLRVAKEWFAPVSRVLGEIDWLTEAQTIVPGRVPRVLGADRRRGAFVMEFLAQAVPWKSELLAGHVDLAVGETVAADLARIHRATARDPEMRRRFAHDATFFAIRLEPYLVETARVHPDLARELVALVHTTQNTPLALVHGDVSPKNILLGSDGPVLLDAECACYGDPAFDLAFLVNHALLKAVHLPAHAGELLALYDCITTTYLAQVDWEARSDFEPRCAALLPGLLLARIDGKSPVEYLDEIDRARVRSVARALIGNPVPRLDDVRRHVAASLGQASDTHAAP